jgi:hypothetical protein
MEAPLIQIKIERDMMHKPTVRVFPHEIPVLQAKHGPDKVFEVESAEPMKREFDPALQYSVLLRKYGADESGQPWVTNVYGQEFEGRFDKAMERGANLDKKEKENGTARKDKDS